MSRKEHVTELSRTAELGSRKLKNGIEAACKSTSNSKATFYTPRDTEDMLEDLTRVVRKVLRNKEENDTFILKEKMIMRAAAKALIRLSQSLTVDAASHGFIKIRQHVSAFGMLLVLYTAKTICGFCQHTTCIHTVFVEILCAMQTEHSLQVVLSGRCYFQLAALLCDSLTVRSEQAPYTFKNSVLPLKCSTELPPPHWTMRGPGNWGLVLSTELSKFTSFPENDLVFQDRAERPGWRRNEIQSCATATKRLCKFITSASACLCDPVDFTLHEIYTLQQTILSGICILSEGIDSLPTIVRRNLVSSATSTVAAGSSGTTSQGSILSIPSLILITLRTWPVSSSVLQLRWVMPDAGEAPPSEFDALLCNIVVSDSQSFDWLPVPKKGDRITNLPIYREGYCILVGCVRLGFASYEFDFNRKRGTFFFDDEFLISRNDHNSSSFTCIWINRMCKINTFKWNWLYVTTNISKTTTETEQFRFDHFFNIHSTRFIIS
eukprot:284818375_4